MIDDHRVTGFSAALLQALDDARLEFDGRRSSVLCADIATILEESMGGTSGARTYETQLFDMLILAQLAPFSTRSQRPVSAFF